MIATWALGGLILSLGGSVFATTFGQTNHAVVGFVLGLFAFSAALSAVLACDLAPNRMTPSAPSPTPSVPACSSPRSRHRPCRYSSPPLRWRAAGSARRSSAPCARSPTRPAPTAGHAAVGGVHRQLPGVQHSGRRRRAAHHRHRLTQHRIGLRRVRRHSRHLGPGIPGVQPATRHRVTADPAPRLRRRSSGAWHRATASTSMNRSGRNRPATWTSELIGGRSRSMNSSRTARTVVRAEVSTTKNVSLKTSRQPAPAASSAVVIFCSTSRVWASQLPGGGAAAVPEA